MEQFYDTKIFGEENRVAEMFWFEGDLFIATDRGVFRITKEALVAVPVVLNQEPASG